jgi:hypothetical protein
VASGKKGKRGGSRGRQGRKPQGNRAANPSPEQVRQAEASIIQPGARGQITVGDPEGTGSGRGSAEFAARLSEVAPGLAAKMAQGMGPEELSRMAPQIARAMHAAGAESGSYSFTSDPVPEGPSERKQDARTGPEIIVTDDLDDLGPDDVDLVIEDLDPDDPDDSGRMLIGSAAQVRRYHERERELEARARRKFGSSGSPVNTEEAADLIRLRQNWDADDVLGHHGWLTHHYRNPSANLADYLALVMRQEMGMSTLAASTFNPVDLTGGPADLPEGAHLAQVVGRGLAESETFQVTAPMCAMMRDTWDADRSVPGLPLDEGELPVPSGFAWLDAPWLIREDGGYYLPVRAASWHRTIVMISGDDGFPQPAEAVRLGLWLTIDDALAFGHWSDPRRAAEIAGQLGQVVLHRVMVMMTGGPQLSPRRTCLSGMLALFHVLWMYLGMELPRSRSVTASAPAVRRRVQKSLKHDKVHIITLRKYDYIGDRPLRFPKLVNWTCRWWTETFWRHIDRYEDEDADGRRRHHKPVPALRTGLVYDDDHDVCAVCLAQDQVVRVTQVHGFWKGPTDKPIRTPAKDRTLQRLSR